MLFTLVGPIFAVTPLLHGSVWSDAESVLRWLLDQEPWVINLVLGLSAALEYVFPPFPGDTVAIAGAVLVAAYDKSFWMVFFVVNAGSFAGAAIDYAVGKRWAAARRGPVQALENHESALAVALDALRRRGAWIVALNRFVPGIRALFFVAAGLAGLSFWRVMAWGLLSAATWNLLLMGLGYTLGAHIAQLQRWVENYFSAVAIVGGTTAIFGLVFWLLRRRRKNLRKRS